MKKKKSKQVRKPAIGGLIGRNEGGTVKNCRASGKIIIKGDPSNIDAGSLIGQNKDGEVINSSADMEIIVSNDNSPNEQVIEVKPNFYGIGINLRALYCKIFHRGKNR